MVCHKIKKKNKKKQTNKQNLGFRSQGLPKKDKSSGSKEQGLQKRIVTLTPRHPVQFMSQFISYPGEEKLHKLRNLANFNETRTMAEIFLHVLLAI